MLELVTLASQQNEVVIPPEVDTRSMSSKYNPSQGETSLQANLMASLVAEVPLTFTNEMFLTLTAQVCNFMKSSFN